MRTARMVLTPWLCKKSMISRICFASCHACAIRSWRFGPIPSTECNSDGRLSMTTRISAPKCSTSFLARIGPMPFTRPLPRYRSIPSAVVGGTVFRYVALNCRPCSLFLTQQPSAATQSPAVTDGREPTTVTSSRCPFTVTRRTQKPLSSLWKVTRSMSPEICSVEGLRSGLAAFMVGFIVPRRGAFQSQTQWSTRRTQEECLLRVGFTALSYSWSSYRHIKLPQFGFVSIHQVPVKVRATEIIPVASLNDSSALRRLRPEKLLLHEPSAKQVNAFAVRAIQRLAAEVGVQPCRPRADSQREKQNENCAAHSCRTAPA